MAKPIITTDKSTYTEGEDVLINISADAGVGSVDLYVNDKLVSTLDETPFEYTLEGVQINPVDDTIIHLKFEDDTSDSSSQKNDAFIVKVSDASFITGPKGKALSIGNDPLLNNKSYVVIPSSERLAGIEDKVTIAFWARGVEGTAQMMFGTDHDGGNSGLRIQTLGSDNRLQFWINQREYGNTYRLLSSSTSASGNLSQTVWKHFCFVYDGTTAKSYVDGVLLNTISVPGISVGNNAHWLLGSGYNESMSLRIGDIEIDDFRVYDYAISEPQISGIISFDNLQKPVKIHAVDNLDQTSDDKNIDVVKGNRPPVAIVNSPSNGEEIEEGFPIIVSILAGDPELDLNRVELYDDETLLHTITSEPYEWAWNGASVGQRNLVVKAIDGDGFSRTLEPIIINVGERDMTPRIIKENNVSDIIVGIEEDYLDDPLNPGTALVDAVRLKQTSPGFEDIHVRIDTSIRRTPDKASSRHEVDVRYPMQYVSGGDTFRSEVLTSYSRIVNDHELWGSISFYWDHDQIPDKDQESIMQWHATGSYPNPMFKCYLINGMIHWEVRWVTSGRFADIMTFCTGPYTPGEWQDFVYYIKLSDRADEGRFLLYKNRKIARIYHPTTGAPFKVPTTWSPGPNPLSHVATPDKGYLPDTAIEEGVECSVVNWYGKTSFPMPVSVNVYKKWGIYKYGWNYVNPDDPLNSGTDTTNRVLYIANVKFAKGFHAPESIFSLLDADGLEIIPEGDIIQEWDISVLSTTGGSAVGSVTLENEDEVTFVSGTFEDGTELTLTATPDSGYVFDGWFIGGSLFNLTNPLVFNIDSNIIIQARFSREIIIDPDLKKPTGIDLEGSYNNTGDSHIDRWAGGGGNYYNSIEEALFHIPEVKRKGTTFVVLNHETGEKEEWHWPNPNNITDSGVKPKLPLQEIDQKIKTIIPIGLKGQIVRFNKDNSRNIDPYDLLIKGNYISSDEELNESKLTIISQEDIFNNWFRFSHGLGVGGNPLTYLERSNEIPGIPLQTNSWSYDNVNNLIRSTQNTASHIGFVSRERLSRYSLSATLSSTSDDNDRLGFVIAFVEDSSDMVPNNAYGLDEADFSWDIDTESERIPNQHTLTVIRNRELYPRTVPEREHSFFVVYNFGKNDEKIIAWNDNAWPTPPETTAGDQWYWNGAEVDMRVVRNGDIVTIYSSDCSDSPNGKSGLIHEIVIDLTSDPVLEKFRGPHRFGLSAQSQSLASFTNLEFTDTGNEIYDLRNGNIWVANSLGWVLDHSRNLYNELLPKSLVYNSKFNSLYYVDVDEYAKINIGIDNYAGHYSGRATLNLANVGAKNKFATTGTSSSFNVWHWDDGIEQWVPNYRNLNSDDFYTATVGEENFVRIKRYSSIRTSSANNFSPSITGTTPFMVLEDSFEWKGTYINAFKTVKIKVWGFVTTDEGSVLTLQLHSGDSSGTAGVGISAPTQTVFLLEVDIHIRSNTQARAFLKLTSGGATTEDPSKHAVNMSNFDRAFNTDIPIGIQGSFSVSGSANQCLIRSYEVTIS